MLATADPIQVSLHRQVNHWLQAASRLSALENQASGSAWHGIDHEIGVLLIGHLSKIVDEVVSFGSLLKRRCERPGGGGDRATLQRDLLLLREKYLRAEETIHFYTVAVNSRTNANLSALLRACDILCVRSMRQILDPLGKKTPSVLTYIDKGAGASILKAGLRLWDGGVSPLAAIKITMHNLFRPTAIIHETGHQVAQILGWNEELANVFDHALPACPGVVSQAFSSWASEIAADAFAFVHTGYAAVASLHDVVSGPSYSVFGFRPSDPHPIAYVRVLMNIEMCRQFYGPGPWDELESAFKSNYDLRLLDASSAALIEACVRVLPQVVGLILVQPHRAFGNRALSQLVPPERVSPRELQKLEYIAGPALFTSHAWIWKEGLRLLALNGYKIGSGQGDLPALYQQQQEWMEQLGFAVELN